MTHQDSLAISARLNLPVEAVTEVFAFMGRRGSGKTYGATKLAELFYDHGFQFFAIDPVGVWYGLRLPAEEGGLGLNIPIFGGLHGDLPIEPTAGAMIADLIVSRHLSAVVDVSMFESDADKSRFVTDFAARFFFLKKSSPSAVHGFIEEAQEFIPQNIQKGEERMLHAMQRMIRLGRNYGIGASLISQRPQDVNKKALNQAECVFAFQLTGVQEIAAVAEWTSGKGVAADLKKLLPELERGHAHVWSPAWLRINEEVLIAPKRTLAAGSTPKVGAAPVTSQTLTPIDISNLRESMAATIERAKEDDPVELRKRIKALEKAAASVPVETNALDEETVRMLKEQMEQITADVAIQEERNNFLEALFVKGSALINELGALFGNAEPPMLLAAFDKKRIDELNEHFSQRVNRSIVMVPDEAPVRINPVWSEPGEKIPEGERKVLIVLAQHGSLKRENITALSGYAKSTRDAYLQRLQARGYVSTSNGQAELTREGRKALGPYEPLPHGSALLDWWCARLKGGEAVVLRLLAGSQKGLDRDTITAKTGYAKSTRDAYIQRLAQKLLAKSEGGRVYAAAALFD